MRHRFRGRGARPPWGFAPRKWRSPQNQGAKRRQALVRNAAPGGSPYGKARPFSGRERPAHDAGRRAYRRLHAAFSLVLGTAFWKRKEPFASGPLDSRRVFALRSSAPTSPCGRTHVVGPGGDSRGPRRPGWLGRTRRRRVPPRSHALMRTPSAGGTGL
jgi:hypothetical protein